MGRGAIFVLAVALFQGSLHGDFVLDDTVAIKDNPVVKGDRPWADAWSTKPGERPNKPDVAAIIREAQNSTEVCAHVAFLLIAFAC